MDKTQRYFIDTLNAFLTGNSPAQALDIDIDGFMRLAKIHSVAGIIGQALSKAPLPSEKAMSFFKKKALTTVILSSAHIAVGNKVIAAMDAASIDCVPFKGAIIRELYPVPELRTFSDIDILVSQDRFEDAHNIMISLGFEHTDGKMGVRGYVKDGFNIEIHHTLAGDMTELSEGEQSFFSAAAANILPKKEGEIFSRLNNEYHLAYCIWHLTKHLSGSGAGVRMFMDIALLINNCGNYNRSKLDEFLKELGITKAADSIFALCHGWFPALAKDEGAKISKDAFEAREQYVLSAGTFGFSARTTGSARLRNESGAKSLLGAKAKIVLQMLFPSAEYTAKQYPWYSGSKLLLPAVWIY